MTQKIFMYGAPGSGKDTQGEILAEKLGIPLFSVGKLLRDEVLLGTARGKEIAPYLERGEIVPNDMGRQLLLEKILSSEVQRSGYIVNGFPKGSRELNDFLKIEQPTLVIHLKVSDDVAKFRIQQRGRADDVGVSMDKRLARYHGAAAEVLEHYKHQTTIPVMEIDGEMPREKIAAAILQIIQTK